MWSLRTSNGKRRWVCLPRKYEMWILTNEIDLLKRQIETWKNIPSSLQEMILNEVCTEIRDRIKINNGIMDDETIGFEDNLDALEAELKKRDARRKANKPLPHRVVAAIKEMIRRDSDVQTLENEPDPMEIAPDAE